jgi:hypothetical protein
MYFRFCWRLLLVLYLLGSCSVATAQITNWAKPDVFFEGDGVAPVAKEEELPLPDVAIASNWVEFYVGGETRNRYFLARDSLFVGKDLITRFVSRVLTAGGVENVAVEAIRCATAERRTFAYLRSGQEWMPSRDKRWVSVSTGNRFNAYHETLYSGLLCSAGVPMKPRESLEALARSFTARVGTPLNGYR